MRLLIAIYYIVHMKFLSPIGRWGNKVANRNLAALAKKLFRHNNTFQTYLLQISLAYYCGIPIFYIVQFSLTLNSSLCDFLFSNR